MADPVVVIPRCGDTVKHLPSGETWEVAYADPKTNTLAWFGWPDGQARLSDCELVERCSEEEHLSSVSLWLDEPHCDSRTGSIDSRVGMVRHLYRPMEERRMWLEQLERKAADLAAELARFLKGWSQ